MIRFLPRGRDWNATLVGLPVDDLEVLRDFCDLLIFTLPDMSRSRRRYLDILGQASLSSATKVCAGVLNGHARLACCADEPELRSYGRRALDVSLRKVQSALELLEQPGAEGPTAVAPASFPGANPEPPDAGPHVDLEDEEFVFRAFEAILQRCCRPSEFAAWRGRLRANSSARTELLAAVIAESEAIEARERARRGSTGADFHIMGTGRHVSPADWAARASELAADPLCASPVPHSTAAPYVARCLGRPRVSVITSVYRAGRFIHRFLENMTRQTCFADDVELLVVDAASPEGEATALAQSAKEHAQIRVIRCARRIGIYEAWNIAVGEARGEYLTNANVDDLRRADSLALQAAALDEWPEIDVVYQDFFYTMDPTLSYDEVAAFGYRSRLPMSVDAETIMSGNPPHHAPMWRADLHRQLGLFDPAFKSAGDYEFWMRCVAAGKQFRKVPDPHAVYYQNPAGMSTRPDTAGHTETRAILRRYGRQLCGSRTAASGRAATRNEPARTQPVN